MTDADSSTPFEIIRDARYEDVYRRDQRRQKMRRLVHRLEESLERRFTLPRWKREAAILRQKNNRPKLSTCIITMNSANRIRPLLESIRSFSDEIVVGVDSKTIDNTFEICKGLADELFMIQSDALTCNAGLEALVERCHGDWVLRLDDDEFPEPHIEEVLPAWMGQNNSRREHFTHYKIPRLHLCNVNPMQWVDDGYLYPDYQMRLFRNEASLLTFPGAVGHRGIECSGKRGRIRSVNLVHLNLAINPRFRREEKLRTYIRRLNGEWVHPVNEHALLFEDFHYKIRPYTYPDASFLRRLTETVYGQRAAYGAPV